MCTAVLVGCNQRRPEYQGHLQDERLGSRLALLLIEGPGPSSVSRCAPTETVRSGCPVGLHGDFYPRALAKMVTRSRAGTWGRFPWGIV